MAALPEAEKEQWRTHAAAAIECWKKAMAMHEESQGPRQIGDPPPDEDEDDDDEEEDEDDE